MVWFIVHRGFNGNVFSPDFTVAGYWTAKTSKTFALSMNTLNTGKQKARWGKTVRTKLFCFKCEIRVRH
jgi:hypothetical protein